jgi:DnaJ-class molecular chaperone
MKGKERVIICPYCGGYGNYQKEEDYLDKFIPCEECKGMGRLIERKQLFTLDKKNEVNC